MNKFDLIILLPIAYGLIHGLLKGFIKEAISLVSIIVALVVAELFSSTFAPFVANLIDTSERLSITISYFSLFILTLVAAAFLSGIIHRVIRAVRLGWINSLLGGVLGALKIALIVSIVMNLFDLIDSRLNFSDEQMKSESISYKPILHLAPKLWNEASKSYTEHTQSEIETDSTLEEF